MFIELLCSNTDGDFVGSAKQAEHKEGFGLGAEGRLMDSGI
jgi:hypothetical protein